MITTVLELQDFHILAVKKDRKQPMCSFDVVTIVSFLFCLPLDFLAFWAFPLAKNFDITDSTKNVNV